MANAADLTVLYFAASAAGLQAAGFALIINAVLRGHATPNPVSWTIWSVVATLAAASSWQAGATGPLAGALMNALGCILVLAVSFGRGRSEVVRSDLLCLLVSASGLIAWVATDDPVLGLLLFLGADACGALPTLRSVLADPTREHLRGWVMLTFAGVAALLSVEAHQWLWSWEGFGFWGGAAYVALVNLVITLAILLGRIMGGMPRLSRIRVG